MTDFQIMGKNKYLWHACENCGRERWVRFVKGQPLHSLCLDCVNSKHGDRAHAWKEGMMSVGMKKPENKCHRCNGLGTIPTPDGKMHQICPICGGSGVSHPKADIKWG